MNENIADVAPQMKTGWRWRTCQIMFRWVIVSLAAAAVALVIANALKGSTGWMLTVSTSGIAIATLLNFLPDLIALARHSREYIRGDLSKAKELAAGFWEAWATLTAIFVTLLVFGGPTTTDPPVLVVYAPEPSPPPKHAIEMFPAFYKNSASSRNWATGVAFTSDEIDVSIDKIRRLVDALVVCGTAQPENPVRLTVFGFASSKEFQQLPIEDPEKRNAESNRLNVEVANRRAWEAYRFLAKTRHVHLQNPEVWANYRWENPAPDPLDQETSPFSLIVTLKQWDKTPEGWKSMRDELPLNDRPLYSIGRSIAREPEELDRRVQFNVDWGGACDKRKQPAY